MPPLPVGRRADGRVTLLLIDGKHFHAEHFGELSQRVAAREIHLEEAIRTFHESFGEDCVAFVSRADVRNVALVSPDGDLTADGESGDGTVRHRGTSQAGHDVGGVIRRCDQREARNTERLTAQHEKERRRGIAFGALGFSRVGPLEEPHGL